MFDPTDFLSVARDLTGSERLSAARMPLRSAYLRTAFGRAYYALYLLVRAELSARHNIPYRRLPHGAVYTHLQSARASKHVRELGRDLQRMYTLRQKADYDVAPDAGVKWQLEDADLIDALIDRAEQLAATLPRLDFSPIVPLFRP